MAAPHSRHPTVFTAGHSNQPADALLDLFARHGVRTVVDVRSSPYSQYATQFNREAFQAAFDAAFGSSASPHGSANATSNRPVFIPNGNYKLNSTLNLTRDVAGFGVTRRYGLTRIRNLRVMLQPAGPRDFGAGFYAYVGSAMNGIEQRVARHRRKDKRLHWHIDYLLKRGGIQDVVRLPSRRKTECQIASEYAAEFAAVHGFGSSDCRCPSHLFFLGTSCP